MVVGLRHDRSKSNFYQKYMLMITIYLLGKCQYRPDDTNIRLDHRNNVVLFSVIYRPNRLWLRNTKGKSSLAPTKL